MTKTNEKETVVGPFLSNSSSLTLQAHAFRRQLFIEIIAPTLKPTFPGSNTKDITYMLFNRSILYTSF